MIPYWFDSCCSLLISCRLIRPCSCITTSERAKACWRSPLSHSQCCFFSAGIPIRIRRKERAVWCPVCLLPHPTQPALCCVSAWFTTSTLLRAVPACFQCKLNHQSQPYSWTIISKPALQFKLNHQSQPGLQCKLNHQSQPYMSSVQAEPPKPAQRVFSACWTISSKLALSSVQVEPPSQPYITCLQCKLNHQS